VESFGDAGNNLLLTLTADALDMLRNLCNAIATYNVRIYNIADGIVAKWQ
jgi:hypothetical protein